MNYMNRELFRQHAMEGQKPVLVAFCASWCGYCRRILPALKRLADSNRGKRRVGVLDNDMEPEMFREEEIEMLPTLILYRGGEVLGSIVGPESQNQIEEFLRETIAL